MSEVLAARGLSRSFGSIQAVQDVSFKVHACEVVGLPGPNGAGKTTILRMIAGVVSPDTGRILLNGVDISSDPIAAKRQIGFLSGDTQLYQRLTPKECVEYFDRLYGVEQARLKRRAQELISRLRMENFAQRRCSTLSSGQKQRANIARVFLHEPGLLILDEPTSALYVVS